ncbi:recombinase family protein [Aminipila sp.]|uniref:recombinase family protein n=1 Tax=Aminipila sp. TaxID=2060095 RepID=UPI002897297A|nr:recombinase family protein [Aminipila sp.]
MGNLVKVAVYARVSTENQDDSLENQLKYFDSYIKNQDNMVLVKIYKDDGISGTNVFKRDNFRAMINDASKKEFEMLLTKSVTRFARNTLDSIYYTRQLKNEYNIDVVFILENIDTRRNDYEFMLTITSSMAQEESRKTSESVKFGQKEAMKRGIVFGRREMLGYRIVDKKNMVIVEEEAEVVRSIFIKFLIEGKGTHVIAKELIAEGKGPFNIDNRSKSNYWSSTAIYKILRNEKYVGDLKQQKTWTKSYLDHKKRINKGELEFVYMNGHHPAIISRDIWEKTQIELERRKPNRKENSRYSNRYWSSGKIVCGNCGKNYTIREKKLKDGGIYRAWRCIKAANQGSKRIGINGTEVGCNSESVNEKVLKCAVNEILCKIRLNKEIIKEELIQEISRIRTLKDTSSEKQSIMRKISKLEKKKDKLLDLRLNNELTIIEFKELKERINSEIEFLKIKYKDLEAFDKLQIKELDSINKYVKKIDELLEFNDIASSEEIFREIIEKIVVYDGKVLYISLYCIPRVFKIKYQTFGKSDGYKVKIEILD